MDLIDDIYVNRNKTSRYLFYSLYGHGDKFLETFKSIRIKAMGISDFNIYPYESIFDPYVFLLCGVHGPKSLTNKYIKPKFFRDNFNTGLNFLREHKSYHTDYIFDHVENARKGDYHMIVLKIPEDKRNIKNYFLEGQYSKLYDQKDLETMNVSSKVYSIINKHPDYLPEYLKELNATYKGLNLTIEDVQHHDEFDVKPQLEHEVFNFNMLNREKEEYEKE